MNINNRLLRSGFDRSPNLIWDNTESKYVQDLSKNNWKWTYVYTMGRKMEIRAVIIKKSISIYLVDHSHVSKWGSKPIEKCIFSRTNIYSIKSFDEISKSLPVQVQRDIKLKYILSRRINISRCH